MTDVIAELVEREYAFGFHSDLDTDFAPKGLDEDVVRLISAKKDEPDWLLEWRLGAFRHFLTLEEPTWPNIHHPPIDYQDMHYWAAPKPKPQLASLDEVDPEIRATFEKLGISLAEQERLSGVAVDAIMDSVSVATTFKAALAEAGVIFCSFSEAVREHPDLVRTYLGSVVGYRDNFFAALNSAVFSDGSFCFVPAGVALSDGAVDVLPDQRRPDRPVRTDPDHRRGRRPASATSKGAPRRCATRTSSTPRWSSWSPSTTRRSSTRRCRTGTPAMPTATAASTTSSPNAAAAPGDDRRSPGPRSRPARRSPGSTRASSCRATSRSASSTPSRSPTNHQQADTGTKMIHIGRNTRSTILSKGISAGHAQNTYRGLVKILRSATGARNHTRCDSLLIGSGLRRAHLPLRRGQERHRPGRARGIDLEDRRGPAVLLPPTRPHRGGRHLDDRQRVLPRGVRRAARWSTPSKRRP